MPEFVINKRRDRAALMVAQDDLPDTQIAAKIGISRISLDAWKMRPEFQARVQEHIEAFRIATRNHGVAIVENRVAAINKRWFDLQTIVR